MNTRERFHAVMNFEAVDRPLYWEFGYWAPTIRRWYREGLERRHGISDALGDDATVLGECLGVDWRFPHVDRDVNRVLSFDEPVYRVPVNNLYWPPFEKKVLEETDEWITATNTEGETVRISKLNGSRHFIDAPVKTRSDYERIRDQRLQPGLEGRLVPDWPQVRKKLLQRTFPLLYGGNVGFYNSPRRFLGFQRLNFMFYDDPQLVKDMINEMADFLIALYDPLLSDIGGDCAMISEDMCYKAGCFVSPAMFREFMLPAYRKLTGFYRDHGIRTILVDSDGDVSGLVPLLIEGGVTGLYPFEVTGNTDIIDIRREHPRFQILGGLDKKAVAAGKDQIDRELEAKVPPLIKSGGYVPFIDHTVPPDISWENFRYYRRRLEELSAAP